MKPTRPTSLYRHFGADDALLYIGITCSIPKRIEQHAKHSGWWQMVNRIEIEHYPDRPTAIRAEREAIISESPAYNRHHNLRTGPIEQEAPLTQAGENITARIVGLRPLYRVRDAADLLGIGSRTLNAAIDQGLLGTVAIPSPRTGKPLTFITGWQILDWLESLPPAKGTG